MQRGTQLPKQELIEIATRICDAYASVDESGKAPTLTNICNAANICRQTFYKWTEYYDEINELYKKAKQKRNTFELEALERTARITLQRQINEGVKTTTYKKIGGEVVEEIEKVTEAPATHVYFVLKSLDPAFKENATPESSDKLNVQVEFISPTKPENE